MERLSTATLPPGNALVTWSNVIMGLFSEVVGSEARGLRCADCGKRRGGRRVRRDPNLRREHARGQPPRARKVDRVSSPAEPQKPCATPFAAVRSLRTVRRAAVPGAP